MKHLAKLIYNLFYWIDVKLGTIEEYDYEAAPYCGHHHNGHKGKFTHSDFHEGMGGKGLNTKCPFLKIYWHDEEKWSWARPCIAVKMRYFINGIEELKPSIRYGLKNAINAIKLARKTKRDTKGKMIIKLKFSLA